MKRLTNRLGFTLMEVNLAIFIMAAGVLAMVSLYPLGYRENQQSKDDVKSAAAADAILNQVTAALSARNLEWDDWRSAVENAVGKTGTGNNGGWMAYCDSGARGYTPKKRSQVNSLAQGVFNALTARYQGTGSFFWPPASDDGLVCALVAQWGTTPVPENTSGEIRMHNDYSRVAVSLRVARHAGALFASPIYYTEVHFQGDQKE